MSEQQQLKAAAARSALTCVESGMSVGLGSGSTAEEFVRQLGAHVADGKIRGLKAVCTSRKTEMLARSLQIEIETLENLGRLDLAIDGADEIDPQLRLIKGLGGALLREKIVEQAAARFIVIADESKLVSRLGQGRLPIEVVTFASMYLYKRFEAMGLTPAFRMVSDIAFLTDESHHIIDVRLPASGSIDDLVREVVRIAGVVETGFFPDEATEAFIASDEGVRRLQR